MEHVLCRAVLPPGTLLRLPEEGLALRSCAGSKSFCPISNFELPKSKTCRVHLAWTAGSSAKRALSSQDHDQGQGRRSRPSAEDRLVTLDDMYQLFGGNPSPIAATATVPLMAASLPLMAASSWHT